MFSNMLFNVMDGHSGGKTEPKLGHMGPDNA